MPEWTDISTWDDPLHKVMAAQGVNILRMEAGLDLGSFDIHGDPRVIIGPKPAVVRLYDQPARLHRQARYEDAERIVTIGPINDKPHEGRVVNRDGRLIQYAVACQISLTEEEQVRDRDEEATDSPLARKAAAWVRDFRSVFNDNDHLIHAGCPTGLVDHHTYEIVWDPEVMYPSQLSVILVTASLYA